MDIITPALTAWLETVATTLVVATIIYVAVQMYGNAVAQAQSSFIVRLVRSAEQMLPGATGDDKLAWVLAQVRELFPRLRLSENLLRVLIESEVQKVKAERSETVARSATVEQALAAAPPKSKPRLVTGA